MKLLQLLLFSTLLLVVSASTAQNVGVGTNSPTEKLDVAGKVRTNALILTNGGAQYDFLIKSNATGEVGFRKANGGVAINYIICYIGAIPSAGGPPITTPMLGEIKPFAGSFAPAGWLFCQGQLMSIAQHPSLYNILGITYGGNGQTTFALPDLRGTAAVGTGAAFPAGYQWLLGERTN